MSAIRITLRDSNSGQAMPTMTNSSTMGSRWTLLASIVRYSDHTGGVI
jgi:hypothetical protein